MNDLRYHTGPGPAADPFGGAFTGRRVLLTGQTGFKGGWLAMWLDRLGAETRAVALPPDTQPALYHLARIDTLCDSRFADINAPRDLARAVAGFRPDLIIHMAAQAIVRDGYDRPAETFATNVVGTANVLAGELGIPTDLGGACRLLAGEHRLARIDAMEVAGKHYDTQLGVGLDVERLLAHETGGKARIGVLVAGQAGAGHLEQLGRQRRRRQRVGVADAGDEVLVVRGARRLGGHDGGRWGER